MHVLSVTSATPGRLSPSLWACVTLVAGLMSQSGCAALSGRIVSDLTSRELAKQGEITLFEGDLSLFRGCLINRGGSCSGSATDALVANTTHTSDLAPIQKGLSDGLTSSLTGLDDNHPSNVTSEVFKHPFYKKIVGFHDHLRGLDPGGAPDVSMQEDGDTVALDLSTDLPEIRSFSELVNRATASGGWESLANNAAQHKKVMGVKTKNSSEHLDAKRDLRTLVYIREYVKAYFDQGKFVQVELNTSDLQQQVDDYLSKELPWACGDQQLANCDQLVEKFVDGILKGVKRGASDKQYMFVSLGSGGFVTRDNRVYQFPGFRVTIDPGNKNFVSPNKIDFTTVGNELLAVFLQAIFDSHEGLPAVPGATGTDLGSGNETDGLPVFDPQKGNVSTDDFQRVSAVANRVEAAISSTVDRVIQGVGPFSLNNDAIEQLIVTAVGVSVRKIAEKAAWCWFACDLDTKGKEAVEKGQKAREFLRPEVKRVKLRLRIGDGFKTSAPSFDS